MDKLVEIKHLNLIYQSVDSETHALDDINLEIDNQEFVSIVGPSGCGKTTILSLISGLMRPTSGDIKVSGKSPSPKDNLTGYMFQRDNLLPWRNIEKNIYFGLEIKRQKTNERKKYALDLAKKYGFNLVRFHSTIPTEEFVEAADEEGLLIHMEIGFAYEYDSDGNKKKLSMDNTAWRETILRYRNHPSVAIFCIGNEMHNSGHQPEVHALYALGKELAPAKLIMDNYISRII